MARKSRRRPPRIEQLSDEQILGVIERLLARSPKYQEYAMGRAEVAEARRQVTIRAAADTLPPAGSYLTAEEIAAFSKEK